MDKTPILPKLVLTDIDGVWTDGGMYYDQTGNEWKKFNTSDSAGVTFLRHLHIPLAVITGEDTQIMKRRAEKLRIEHLFMGIKNKLEIANKLCSDLKIELSEVAFIGDDLGDLALLKKVGFSCAPKNAPDYIKKHVHHVVDTSGGDGAFRAFVEYILAAHNLLDRCVEEIAQQKA
jgi:3-deoxy-D-manno-octulosonate 8-phosphate phosphatase (KDO 8-P phosphatase)